VGPALVGGARCLAGGSFRLAPVLLVLAGVVLAEVLSLVAADLADGVAGSAGRAPPFPQLPGSPVLPRRLVPPRRLPVALAVLAVPAAAVLAVLFARTGGRILLVLLPAVAAGALYALQPVPAAAFATAVVPPLITAGTVLAVSGRWEWGAAAIGIPGALSAVGVIGTYRTDLWPGLRPRGRAIGVFAAHAAAIATLPVLVAAGIAPLPCLLATAPPAALLVPLARLLRRASEDPVPATAVGVFLHATLHVALAVTLAA